MDARLADFILSNKEARQRVLTLLIDDAQLGAYLDAKTKEKLGRNKFEGDDDDPEWYERRAKVLEKIVSKIDWSKV
jgi:hypothetical protein